MLQKVSFIAYNIANSFKIIFQQRIVGIFEFEFQLNSWISIEKCYFRQRAASEERRRRFLFIWLSFSTLVSLKSSHTMALNMMLFLFLLFVRFPFVNFTLISDFECNLWALRCSQWQRSFFIRFEHFRLLPLFVAGFFSHLSSWLLLWMRMSTMRYAV